MLHCGSSDVRRLHQGPRYSEPMKNVGERVRMLRAALRMSQSEFALRSSIARSTLTRIENDGAEASAVVRASIARGLGVPVEALGEFFDGAMTLSDLMSKFGRPGDLVPLVPPNTPWDVTPEQFDERQQRFPTDYPLTVGFLIAYGAPPRVAEQLGLSLGARSRFNKDGEPDPQTKKRLRVWASVLAESRGTDDHAFDLITSLTDRLIAATERP